MPDLLDKVADAIHAAECHGVEGPFGLYNYESYKGDAAPHVIRDYRPGTATYGATLLRTDREDIAEREYENMTRRYVAKAALNAVLDHLSTEALLEHLRGLDELTRSTANDGG